MLNFFELILITLSISLDILIISITLGLEKIKVPIYSIFILNFISTLFLIISCLISRTIFKIIPYQFGKYFTPCFFLFLGGTKLSEGITHPKIKKTNYSKILNFKNLILLGISVSLDNLIVGFGINISESQLLYITILHFIFGSFFFTFFNRLTLKIPISDRLNVSIISGFIFLIVGIYRIFI